MSNDITDLFKRNAASAVARAQNRKAALENFESRYIDVCAALSAQLAADPRKVSMNGRKVTLDDVVVAELKAYGQNGIQLLLFTGIRYLQAGENDLRLMYDEHDEPVGPETLDSWLALAFAQAFADVGFYNPLG